MELIKQVKGGWLFMGKTYASYFDAYWDYLKSRYAEAKEADSIESALMSNLLECVKGKGQAPTLNFSYTQPSDKPRVRG